MDKKENKQIRIIALSPERWSEYKALRLRALQEDAPAFGESLERALAKSDSEWQQRATEGYMGQSSWMLFAENQSNQLLGMMGAFRVDEKTANIFGVYVAPEARGLGVSKRLIAVLIEKLKTSQFSIVKLSVNKSQLPAVKLYQNFGFQVTGEENVQLGDGNYYDEFLMERSI